MAPKNVRKGRNSLKSPNASADTNKTKGKIKVKDEDDMAVDDLADEFYRGKLVVKPDDQEVLTENELKEEVTRILTANDPHAPQNIIQFNYKEGVFKHVTHIEQTAIHFAHDGNLYQKDSDEARRMRNKTSGKVSSDHTVSEMGEDDSERDDQISPPMPSEHLRNKFNFSERGSQTFNYSARECLSATDPPPRSNFSADANQWEMYDAYYTDLKAQERLKEKVRSLSTAHRKDENVKKNRFAMDHVSDDISKITEVAKIVERMINQNTYDDIAQDFKYFEDISDEYKDGEGTMLPLWKFCYDKAKRLSVTALCWNPKHYDLLACGFGSFNFNNQGRGMLIFYSMKNPSYPEFKYSTNSGVMSIDIHPNHQYLVCVGFYDGSVAVYNLRREQNSPLHRSTIKTGKHTGPVWQVRWQNSDIDENLNFYSVSSDGRVVSWMLTKGEISYFDVISLVFNDITATGPGGTPLQLLGCGTSFDFHQSIDLFLVGTEEGKIHKCCRAYSKQFVDTIVAHHMSISAVRWNPYHEDVFISCSADWTVKIWDNNFGSQTMFMYDLNSAVADVAWAPYSSTVFAAVTVDGKIHVFDLHINKYEPLCVQSVVQKKLTQITRIEFNPVHKIVVIGDDRGNATCLKISPNLRKPPKRKKIEAHLPLEPDIERLKFERLLSLVREPDKQEKKMNDHQ